MTESMILTAPETQRFEICKAVVKKGQQTFIEVGNALLEIREKRYYREQFGTFEKFCQAEFHISRIHAHRFILGAKTIRHLLPSPTEKPVNISSGVLPIGNKPISESVIRPLTSLPVPAQKKVFKTAVSAAKAEGREVTARDVKAAMPSPPEVDMIGRKIPKDLLELWAARKNAQAVCDLLSKARGLLREAEENQDKGFGLLNLQSVIASADRLYHEVKTAMPYAVCGLCQGIKCKACKTGIMGKHHWEQLVPRETREMISRGIKK